MGGCEVDYINIYLLYTVRGICSIPGIRWPRGGGGWKFVFPVSGASILLCKGDRAIYNLSVHGAHNNICIIIIIMYNITISNIMFYARG